MTQRLSGINSANAGISVATGTVWYNGTGAPSNSSGNNGDYYLNDSTGDVYTKTSNSWSIIANIKGANGTSSSTINWQTITSNYTASNGDALFIDTSSAALTITLPAGPSIGWSVTVQDPKGTWSTNNVTVHSASEEINYQSSDDLILNVSDGVTLIYSGTSWVVSAGGFGSAAASAPSGEYNMWVFTSTGTFTTPSDSTTATKYKYRMVGAGGSSGGGYTGGSSGGGGAGAYAEDFFTGLSANTAIAITVGVGGSGNGPGSPGVTGGSTSIASPVNVVCGGGGGGVSSNIFASGGTGGQITGSPLFAIPGQPGGDGSFENNVGYGGYGGSGPFGFGGNGNASNGNNLGVAGTGYGSGGGGPFYEVVNGSNGTNGIVIIERVSG